jgi:phosphodiesterase/alkaline phosphatase D-like protein
MSSLELDRRLADLAAPQTMRGVLIGAGSLALAASLSRLPLDLAYGSPPRHDRNPFTLGIASGDPHTHGIVLWTNFYRFITGSAASPVGCTRAAPRGRVSDLTFSFVTCQKWDDGFYPAYREIAREDHDFVVHLGDYTYEYGIANNTGPRNPNLPPEFVTETQTLERYRLQHAL